MQKEKGGGGARVWGLNQAAKTNAKGNGSGKLTQFNVRLFDLVREMTSVQPEKGHAPTGKTSLYSKSQYLQIFTLV